MRLAGSARRYSSARGWAGLAGSIWSSGGVWKLDGQGGQRSWRAGIVRARASRRYRQTRTWNLAQDGAAGPFAAAHQCWGWA